MAVFSEFYNNLTYQWAQEGRVLYYTWLEKLAGTNTLSYLVYPKLRIKLSFMNTTLNFLQNLRINSISYSVTLH